MIPVVLSLMLAHHADGTSWGWHMSCERFMERSLRSAWTRSRLQGADEFDRLLRTKVMSHAPSYLPIRRPKFFGTNFASVLGGAISEKLDTIRLYGRQLNLPSQDAVGEGCSKGDCQKTGRGRVPPHVLKARNNFAYFCELMGKKPARHMREWHKVFLTGQSNEHLLDIAGPNTCLLSPRGSAKSTVLGLLLGWLIGRHALSKKLLRILYVSYNVDVARNKSAAIRTSSARRNTRRYSRAYDYPRCVRPTSSGRLTGILRKWISGVKMLSQLPARALRARLRRNVRR